MRSRSWSLSGSLLLVGCLSAEKPPESEISKFDVKGSASRPMTDEKGEPIPAFKLTEKEDPEPSASVKIQIITSGTSGRVYDSADGAILSNTGELFEVLQSDDPMRLIVNAEGFEPVAVVVVPNADKMIEVEMSAADAGTTGEVEVEADDGLEDPEEPPPPIQKSKKKKSGSKVASEDHKPIDGAYGYADLHQKKMDSIEDDLGEVLEALQESKKKPKK